MTDRVFVLPVLSARETGRRSLSCVWIETGNPRQPLARVWSAPERIEGGMSLTVSPEDPAPQSHVVTTGSLSVSGPQLVCA